LMYVFSLVSLLNLHSWPSPCRFKRCPIFEFVDSAHCVKIDSVQIIHQAHVLPKTLYGLLHEHSISTDHSSRWNYTGVPFSSEGSNGTMYPHTENDTLPGAQATCHVAYVPPALCAWNVVSYTRYPYDTCLICFVGTAPLR
jgi:hypothetical protein